MYQLNKYDVNAIHAHMQEVTILLAIHVALTGFNRRKGESSVLDCKPTCILCLGASSLPGRSFLLRDVPF